jgi:hypothetical protein
MTGARLLLAALLEVITPIRPLIDRKLPLDTSRFEALRCALP